MLTALDYATRAQKRIRDESYPASDMYQHLNESVSEVFNRHILPEEETKYTANLVVGRVSFEFQPDHSTLEALTIIDSTILNDGIDITRNYMPWADFNRMYPNPESQTPQRPYTYTIRNRQIWFSQPVDKPYIMKAEYIKTPTLVTADADVIEIPDNFAELVIMGMCERAEGTKDNFAKAAYYRARFEAILKDFTMRSAVQMIGMPYKSNMRGPWGHGTRTRWGR
jgi:hypothetical protein